MPLQTLPNCMTISIKKPAGCGLCCSANWPADCFSDQFQRLILRIGKQSTKRKLLDMLKVAKRCRFLGLGYAVAADLKLFHQFIFTKFIKIYVHAYKWHDDLHKKAT